MTEGLKWTNLCLSLNLPLNCCNIWLVPPIISEWNKIFDICSFFVSVTVIITPSFKTHIGASWFTATLFTMTKRWKQPNYPSTDERIKMWHAAAAAAKSLQSCPTLCEPRDGSPPGSPVPGILQARTLEWVAISFSNARKWKVKVKSFSRLWLLATPWTAAYQAPLSVGFARQEYWSGLPLPSPKMWHKYTYMMEYYSAIKRNEIRPFVEMWMNPECVIQSEVSKRKTSIIY